MTLKKKLKIAAITLVVVALLSFFGLCFVSDIFACIFLYLVLGAGVLGITIMEMKSENDANFIFIGIGYLVIGSVLYPVGDEYRWINNIFSIIYIVFGILSLVKGIKIGRIRKKTQPPKMRIPWNKAMYVGIVMIVLGIVLIPVFAYFQSLFMALGSIMVLSGIIVAGYGNEARKKGRSASFGRGKTVQNAKIQEVFVNCIRCGKRMYEKDLSNAAKIDGEIYCMDCVHAMEKDMENQHIICSECGIDLPMENMHMINDDLLCHSCFLKRYGKVDSFEV